MLIEGAIFDVDGTLLNSMPIWANSGELFLAGLGIKAEHGLGDKLFSMTVPMGAKYIKEKYRPNVSTEEIITGINAIAEDYYFNRPELKPGALELLEKLKSAGVRMVIATSTARYCIETAIEKVGIDKYFEDVYTCIDVGASKSEPKIFHAALDKLGTSVDKTWVFEDGLYAMKTAKSEGFKIAGIYDRTSEKDQDEIKKISDVYMTNLYEFNII